MEHTKTANQQDDTDDYMQDGDIQEQDQDTHEAIESNEERHPAELQTHKAGKKGHESGTRGTKQAYPMQDNFDPHDIDLGYLDWEKENEDRTSIDMGKYRATPSLYQSMRPTNTSSFLILMSGFDHSPHSKSEVSIFEKIHMILVVGHTVDLSFGILPFQEESNPPTIYMPSSTPDDKK